MDAKTGNQIDRIARQLLPELRDISEKLYRNPEIGGEERFASGLLTEALRRHGFSVTETFGGIPYAFRASYSLGVAGKNVAFFAEYDALPQIGHGCGHNLICSAALGAAFTLKAVAGELPGTILVYGTPGEENLCTKTLLADQGLFDEADAGLMVHPYPFTCSSGRTLALEALQIEFLGRSAHAGTEPEKGINALDAAVLFYHLMQEESQKRPEVNVHGIINDGGRKASVIPDHTSLLYLNRAWTDAEIVVLRQMTEFCAQKAADATGCHYRISSNEPGNHAMRTHPALSDRMNAYLRLFGELEIRMDDIRASTDMADVSLRIPAIHTWVGMDCPELALHTQAFAEKTISPAADTFLLRSSCALASTALDVLTDNLHL